MKHTWSAFLVAVVCALSLTGCARPHPASSNAAADQQALSLPASNATAAQLNAIAETYWDEYLALHPLTARTLGDSRFDDRFGDQASPGWMADGLAIEQETLEKLAALDSKQLDADERLTYESLKAA